MNHIADIDLVAAPSEDIARVVVRKRLSYHDS